MHSFLLTLVNASKPLCHAIDLRSQTNSPSLPHHTNKHLLMCKGVLQVLKKSDSELGKSKRALWSLSKAQVTTKDIKREDVLHQTPNYSDIVCRGFFQSPSIYGANFSNNISISQVKIKMRENKHDRTFETS